MLSRFSRVRLYATPGTVARQAPLPMGFSRQEYWSGLPCPPPGDLPDPGIEPTSLTSPALAGGFFTTSSSWEALQGSGSQSVAPRLAALAHEGLVLSYSVVSDPCDPMDYSPPGSSVHGDSPGKNTRVGCHALLQGIFPT